MVKGHHPQLRCHSLTFHKFKQFRIKAAVPDQPVIQKEVGNLLTKGAIVPHAGGVGFHFKMFSST